MISNSRHSRWSALCGRALSLAAALALSSAAMAEKLTIVSTDFVLERKFEMLQRAAEGTGLTIDWVQVDVHNPARISEALEGADIVIIDAPRSDDQALVQGMVGDFLNSVDIPILSVNVMSPPVRMRGVRLEAEHAQRMFDYYAGGTSVNFNRLAQYAQALLTGASVAAIEPALELPERAIYHPDYESLVFSDLDTYLAWWQNKYSLSVEGKPVIGMEMSSSYISDGQTGMMDRFALEVREAGAVPVILYRSSRVASTRSEMSGAQGGGRPADATAGSGSGRPASAGGSGGGRPSGRPAESFSPASSTAAHSDPNSTDVSQDFMNPLDVATLDLTDDALVMRDGKVFMDVIVINTFLGSDPEGRKAWLKALGIPAINAVQYRDGTYQEYLQDTAGISNFGIPTNLIIAEYIGLIDPVVITTNEDGEYVPVEEHIDMLLQKALNLSALRRAPNADKKLALFFWNHPPGEHNMGASNLNVPVSVASLAAALREDGYNIDPVNDQQLIDSISDMLRPYYRSEGIVEIQQTSAWDFLPLSRYETWLATLPASVRDNIVGRWGAPQDSHWVIERDGEKGFVIPRTQYGNLYVLPQPSRGDAPAEENDVLYHDTLLPVHHGYLATYLWVREQIGADAIIHFGTHGSQEWLPGKERGLWIYDNPNLLVGNIPVIYPYIVDNMSEAVHVKRRGRGVVVSHQTPPFSPAGLSDDFSAINDLITEYQLVDEGLVKENARELIVAKAVEMNIHTDLDWTEEQLMSRFDEFLRDIENYLEELGMAMQPLGMHAFGTTALDEHLSSNIMQMLGEPLVQKMGYASVAEAFKIDYQGLRETRPYQFVAEHIVGDVPLSAQDGEDTVLVSLRDQGKQYLRNLNAGGEINAVLAGLSDQWIDPSYGGDPIRNPDALPTGRNMYGFDPARVPTRSAWAGGQDALQSLIDSHQQTHGVFPEKLAFAMRSTETVRHLGMLEAQVFDALGVRPQWDSGGRVTGMELIPLEELGRPRIDVVVSITGLYRDQYPIVMERFNEAVLLAANADEPLAMNFVRANSERILGELTLAGVDESTARNAALTRVFGNESGDYGTGLPDASLMSDKWEADDGQLAEVYLSRMSWAYGPDPEQWSRKITAPDGSPVNVYSTHLKGTSAAVMSRSSNLRGLLDNDHSFEYLGGISLAVQHLDGAPPQMYISNMRDPARAKLQRAEQFLAMELRAVYQHPNWIKEMEAEGYAGTLQLLETINNFWGWQVMDASIVRDDQWDEFHATYVMDRYDLGTREWFEETNPEALAQITERMLEAARKGYWEASEQTLRELVETYTQIDQQHDVFTANDDFQEYVNTLAMGFGLNTATPALEADAMPEPANEAISEPTQEASASGESVTVQGQVMREVAMPTSEDIRQLFWLWLLIGMVAAGMINRDLQSRRIDSLY